MLESIVFVSLIPILGAAILTFTTWAETRLAPVIDQELEPAEIQRF